MRRQGLAINIILMKGRFLAAYLRPILCLRSQFYVSNAAQVLGLKSLASASRSKIDTFLHYAPYNIVTRIDIYFIALPSAILTIVN